MGIIVVIATCKNIVFLIDKPQPNFSEPGCPWIIFRKLTMKVIEEVIVAYGYWLKLRNFASEIYMEVFDKLQKYQAEYNEEFNNF